MKRKKNTRQRGNTTHGWGSMKKHRGKGNKGGAGNAGSGKRGDAKNPSTWKTRYFGKYGFKKKGMPTALRSINIGQLKLEKLLAAGTISKEGDTFIIDLSSLGVDKLLGAGNVTQKLKISALSATQKAIDKVVAAGGQVNTQKEE